MVDHNILRLSKRDLKKVSELVRFLFTEVDVATLIISSPLEIDVPSDERSQKGRVEDDVPQLVALRPDIAPWSLDCLLWQHGRLDQKADEKAAEGGAPVGDVCGRHVGVVPSGGDLCHHLVAEGHAVAEEHEQDEGGGAQRRRGDGEDGDDGGGEEACGGGEEEDL
eukprot:CAMPEP_0195627428 /NCGR_PEP_ID=MMETSP0815-20121206/18919_1 /TAXON_ID=97485 /ORGANISM="Prymnesium parvum, Strain Texoma1" /LENGTH=165 /DNA_ID=CAMNT_0040768647 /DNA_START=179 /DNA_END=672 /DNA_ORIENTATION=+